MRKVFTLVYLTVGYLGALQYVQMCATTMVCLTVDGHRPPEAIPAYSCVSVRPTANPSRGSSHQRLSLSDLLTSHTCCVTDRFVATNASFCLWYRGIPIPISTLAVTGRNQLSPYYAKEDNLSKAVKEIPTQGGMSHKSTREIPTLPKV